MNLQPEEVLGERSWAIKDYTDKSGWVGPARFPLSTQVGLLKDGKRGRKGRKLRETRLLATESLREPNSSNSFRKSVSARQGAGVLQ